MPKYVTAIEVKTTRMPNSTALADWSNWEDEDLDILIDAIEAELELSTGTIFLPVADYEIIINGTGFEKLFPKEEGMNHRMLSVASVEIVEFDGTVEQLLESGKHYIFDPKKPYYLIWNMMQSYSVRKSSESSVSQSGKGWPPGQRNIRVVADIGMAETPEEVKQALIRWITAEALGPVHAGFIASTGESGKVQEVWEDYTVTYGSSATDKARKNYGIGNISGYLHLDRVFSKYINMAGLFNVV